MTLSIILPAYVEPYMNKTITSLLDNAVGEVEIIPVFDGRMPDEPVVVDPRVQPIYLEQHVGMRGCINAGILKAQGEFIMKCDAHCIFAPGFDKILLENMRDNWVMVPRLYVLDEQNWERNITRPPVDYHMVTFPGTLDSETQGITFHVISWERRGREEYEIDDTLVIQGSCWLANKKYFMEHVGFLNDSPDGYGSFIQEQQEICFKYWLSGGEVKVNKKTWYAHLSKRRHHYSNRFFSRRHKKDLEWINGNIWGTNRWINDLEPNMQHSFKWLIDKFFPIPTWALDWEKILTEKHILNKK